MTGDHVGAVKYIALAASVPLGGLPIAAVWIVILLAGLLAGTLARAARMFERRAPWAEIRRDLIVSLLIFGANGLLSALVIHWEHLDYLAGMGVAFLFAFGGVQAIEAVLRRAYRNLVSFLSGKE